MDATAQHDRTGRIAVIFLAARTPANDPRYCEAAAQMDALAARQPGYRGAHSARDAAEFGITVSWWADEAAAIAWREHPVHAETRALGRERWYESHEVAVASVTRSYAWTA